mgnify:CR=1 FL=1
MPRHGHMGPQGADEKAKDLKGTLKKLLHYMSVFKVQMLLIVIFAVCGTTFTIIGPKILGKSNNGNCQRSDEQSIRRKRDGL